MVTLEALLEYGNLLKAAKAVRRNKGAAGIDGVKAKDLIKQIYEHPYELSESIKTGKYKPQPIKRVYIPKPNGEKRPLGISTVIDRTVQAALANILRDEYDPLFSDNSHGFRPNRGCHTAAEQALAYANEGCVYVIDMDLRKFFDTVNHSKMLQVLSKQVKDRRIIKLVSKMLKVKIYEDGKCTKSTIGLPQGSAVSPVLANILLNELDQELDKRGHKFVRYADDMMIFCKSQRAAERVLESVTEFIEGKLFLQVNKDKTHVSRLSPDVKFLGYGFWYNQKDDKWQLCVHSKSKARFREKMRGILDRRCPRGIAETQKLFNSVLRGWTNYYASAISKSYGANEDGWLRRRIRQLYLKVWKRNWTRFNKLWDMHGREPKWERRCAMVAFSQEAYWARARTANSVLSNAILAEEGWMSIAMLKMA